MNGGIKMKKSIILISILLLVSFHPMDTFGGCLEGDCQDGYGTYSYHDGSKYVGEWKDGKKDSQGTYTFSDGSKYVGEWKDGEFLGKSNVE